jgi:hypothetical protein
VSDLITISFKWTPKECRRFERAIRLAAALSQKTVKANMTFRKQLVICAVMCAVFAAGLVALTNVSGMGDSAQVYSLAIGFVTVFTVPFGWAVIRRRTTVSFMSIWAGVGCSFVGPMATGYVPLGSAWPYYLGFMAFFLIPPVAWWAWRKWMSLKVRQGLCASPDARWDLDDRGPVLRFEGSDRTTWEDVECAMRTGDGFLFCLQAKQATGNKPGAFQKLFLWFPIHAFKSADEVGQFAQLAQAKVRRYGAVG